MTSTAAPNSAREQPRTTGGSLRVVAAAYLTHRQDDPELPVVPGFVASTFNPLVHETVRRCLGDPPADGTGNALVGPYPDTTAVLLATVAGDATTSDLASRKLVSGRVHNPLLFFQSVTTSILGHLAIQYGLTGPVSCIAADHGVAEQAWETAELLLSQEPELDQVLLVGIELAVNPRTRAAYGQVARLGRSARPPEQDLAVAVLLRRAVGTEECSRPPGYEGERSPYGSLLPLVTVAERAGRTGEAA
ncbi:ketosynthase [Streptomyces sp. Wh19]|uniref:ketosynthase n=1 Tax=Streptomyces sp. Wh19 TaxID=3076629 RepID=UPI002958B7AF|nr:ketosynthase [Streptomyces sp. Wh19]MDV9194733.1 ketosynthase [Streptomyces sp. Wh19]